jgi:lysophospholipase L1-like esterase
MRFGLAFLLLACAVWFSPHAAETAPRSVLLVGDSVMAALGPENTDAARRIIGGAGWEVSVDGRECRRATGAGCVFRGRDRPRSVLEVLRSRSDRDAAVVIIVGHNDELGPGFRDQVVTVLDELRDAPQVFWLTMRETRPTYGSANQVIVEEAVRRPNAAVIPWGEFSREKRSWVARDGIHLTREGATEMASLILKALEDWYRAQGDARSGSVRGKSP